MSSDNKIILKCNNCDGIGTDWVKLEGTNYRKMITCPFCEGNGTILIDDPRVSQMVYKSYEDTVEDAKVICKRWGWLTKQSNWMAKQLVKKNHVRKYEWEDCEVIIHCDGLQYYYDTGNEEFDKYRTIDGECVFVDWENLEEFNKDIPENVKKFADGLINVLNYVYREMSELSDILGYCFDWDEYSCDYSGDVYCIHMSCYTPEYDPEYVEIEDIFMPKKTIKNVYGLMKFIG